jgi:general secretion pathway protein K
MRCSRPDSRRRRRGAALLAVLWLSAALSAIAFSVASSVQGEIERSSTMVEGVRSYYLATGAIDRTICYIVWGPSHQQPGGESRYWRQGMPRLHHRFPAGDAIVEIIPATAKLNLNVATEEQLFRLVRSLGASDAQAATVAAGIIDWRRPMARNALTQFDQHYLSLRPSFRARHASFEQIEEVLLVKGMTPELFHGSYKRGEGGRLVRQSGLKDCVSVFGSNSQYDVNSADPALLLSLGIQPAAVEEIVRRRRQRPFRLEQLGAIRNLAGNAGNRLMTGGNSIFTLRATARVRLQDGRLSDLRRSAAALVKFMGYGFDPPYRVLRWYDNAPTDTVAWQ